jgi:hypothetical protein
MIKPLLRALRKHKTSKLLFFLLVLIIPLNVGKHVVLRESYVSGLLVDYLIPTIYVQDIVALLLLLAAVVEAFNSKKTFFASPALAVLAVFLFAVFLSALSSLLADCFCTPVFLFMPPIILMPPPICLCSKSC